MTVKRQVTVIDLTGSFRSVCQSRQKKTRDVIDEMQLIRRDEKNFKSIMMIFSHRKTKDGIGEMQ
jgi:hypothetical protein